MNEKTEKSGLSRRAFLGTTAAAAAGFTILPSNVVSGLGYVPPSDKLNIAGVGVGGMGNANLKNLKSQNIVAWADVDWGYCKQNKIFEEYPGAKQYKDWRKMYDEMGKSIDAVVVATADHSHAIVASHAMTMGKHVYVQKPLTHTVYESRLLTKLADNTSWPRRWETRDHQVKGSILFANGWQTGRSVRSPKWKPLPTVPSGRKG
jgi:hypothetical protein